MINRRGQPRPRAFPLKNVWDPTHFFKGKPGGRGCLRGMKKCYPCIEFKRCELNNE